MIRIDSKIYNRNNDNNNNNDRFVEANDFVIDEESEFSHESIVNNERMRKTINLDPDYSTYISDDFRVVHVSVVGHCLSIIWLCIK